MSRLSVWSASPQPATPAHSEKATARLTPAYGMETNSADTCCLAKWPNATSSPASPTLASAVAEAMLANGALPAWPAGVQDWRHGYRLEGRLAVAQHLRLQTLVDALALGGRQGHEADGQGVCAGVLAGEEPPPEQHRIPPSLAALIAREVRVVRAHSDVRHGRDWPGR
eukprot:scaffold17217_cov134-Isochrysis_galbana.AAC.4